MPRERDVPGKETFQQRGATRTSCHETRAPRENGCQLKKIQENEMSIGITRKKVETTSCSGFVPTGPPLSLRSAHHLKFSPNRLAVALLVKHVIGTKYIYARLLDKGLAETTLTKTNLQETGLTEISLLYKF